MKSGYAKINPRHLFVMHPLSHFFLIFLESMLTSMSLLLLYCVKLFFRAYFECFPEDVNSNCKAQKRGKGRIFEFFPRINYLYIP
jgi:hypothetical protein